ncbi:hypothetical protein ACFFIF_01760 [Vagococcus entomophilus]|uniref:hypothetical protein n=1 Tax=Vagococcus entomophilus TaxID=1160095 RepID=UPI00147551A7|nr:hypothetical protein [Vagococcus entomophilus]
MENEIKSIAISLKSIAKSISSLAEDTKANKKLKEELLTNLDGLMEGVERIQDDFGIK